METLQQELSLLQQALQRAATEKCVIFLRPGARRTGDFHCVACGHSMWADGTLPACPTCHAPLWEQGACSWLSEALVA